MRTTCDSYCKEAEHTIDCDTRDLRLAQEFIAAEEAKCK